MGSLERTKKKVQLHNNAIVHFLLCFIIGFSIGFAGTGMPSYFSSRIIPSNESAFSPQPEEINGSFLDQPGKVSEDRKYEENLVTRRLIIVVTPTSINDQLRGVNLRRLGNTLRLVPSPLLWIVVEKGSDSSEASEILRKTGVMYRHLVFKENFTDSQAEMDYQRNFALNHIEHHRLNGIVHFSEILNVYDPSFFDEIRAIEVFGTWPMAFLSANRKRVLIEGPLCDSSQVVGWHLKVMNNNLTADTSTTTSTSPLHISSFAFNSSILWDPERWGRSSSVQETSQNTIKFIKKEILEEETKLIGIPAETCSKIMIWNWNWNFHTSAISSTENNYIPVN